MPRIKLNLICGSKFAFKLSMALLEQINSLWAPKFPTPHPALGAASVRPSLPGSQGHPHQEQAVEGD